MQLMHPHIHNTFNMLIDFRVSKYKNIISDPYYLSRLRKMRFSQFSLLNIHSLLLATFLSSFLPDLSIRLTLTISSHRDSLSLSLKFFRQVIFPSIFSLWFSLSPILSYQPLALANLLSSPLPLADSLLNLSHSLPLS